jgi:hypothetical protein
MNAFIKWGLIALGAYLLWKWWQSRQVTAQPAWTPGLTGPVYGGGALVTPPGNMAPYQPGNTAVASTLVGSGNPGYISPARNNNHIAVVGTSTAWGGSVLYDPSKGSVHPVPFDPVNALGLIAPSARGGPVMVPFGAVRN